ncbi:MAG: methylated-DNA--[protein]-cysteine S-methyltransferase [Sulfuriferula sp.]
MTLRYSALSTLLGVVFVAYNAAGASLLAALPEPDFIRRCRRIRGMEPRRNKNLPSEIEELIDDSITGAKKVTLSKLNLHGLTPFQQKALLELAQISRGQVRTYGWMAASIGHPGAARAIGTAMALNPYPLLLPCHRVIRTDGVLGHYSGGPSGFKARLLELEGVNLTSRVQAS